METVDMVVRDGGNNEKQIKSSFENPNEEPRPSRNRGGLLILLFHKTTMFLSIDARNFHSYKHSLPRLFSITSIKAQAHLYLR